MKVGCSTHDSENQRVIAIERVHYASPAPNVLFRFEKPGVDQSEAQLVDRVVRDDRQPLARSLFNAVESQTAGGFLKLIQVGGRFPGGNARLQQRLDLRPALLSFQDRDAQRYRLSRRIGRDGG